MMLPMIWPLVLYQWSGLYKLNQLNYDLDKDAFLQIDFFLDLNRLYKNMIFHK